MSNAASVSHSPASTSATVPAPARPRIASIDVFRGFVMFLMLFQMVQLPKLAESQLKETSWTRFWQTVNFHTTHVEWEGGSLHDMIQPGFSFLVGAAMAFSLLRRQREGQSWWRMLVHVLIRSAALVALGVLLRNLRTDQIIFRFEDTLCQIGLGYTFLFLIASLPRVWLYAAFVAILIGWWVAFLSYPIASPDFDYAAVGVPADWPNHKAGVAAHWNKNANLAAAFDRWFLNLFPRDQPFTANEGGYCTLNFVPTLATMVLGLIAGTWLREESSFGKRSMQFLGTALICFGVAWLLSVLGWCPIIKRIWTPSWTLWSGGWCLVILYGFHLVCDVGKFKSWAFPLLVIGSNSIAAYVMSFATVPFLRDRLDSWFGFLWKSAGTYAPHVLGLVAFGVIWLVLYWMHRQRLYIRL